MSIKLLAKDLYRLQREVDQLQADIEVASLRERTGLEEKLRVALAQKEQLRRALDGRLQR